MENRQHKKQNKDVQLLNIAPRSDTKTQNKNFISNSGEIKNTVDLMLNPSLKTIPRPFQSTCLYF